MPGTFHSRRVDQPVRFHDRAAGTTVEGTLESIRHFVPDDAPPALVLTVWFDYWTFHQIDRAHLFGYTLDSIDRDGLQSWELTSERPVQLELRAEPALLASLAGLAGDALLDAALAALLSPDPASSLLDAAGYRYLAVYQEQTLGGASFLKGFTSLYRKSA